MMTARFLALVSFLVAAAGRPHHPHGSFRQPPGGTHSSRLPAGEIAPVLIFEINGSYLLLPDLR
jgi:hypothetical protein